MSEANTAQAFNDTTNPTPLLSSVISALSTDATAFTGERFVFGSGVEIFYEHYHRYVFAARSLDSTQTVLDLGCGVGYGSLILASKAKKVVAIDRDQDSIALLTSLLKQLNIQNVETVCGDVSSLEKAITTKIDVVVCHELIEHLPQALQESVVALIASGKPPFHEGTKFLVSTPERNIYSQKNQHHNDFHEFEFSYAEFKHLLSRYFPHVAMYWQGSITGNVIVSEEHEKNSIAANFVHWQSPTKLLGTVSDSPETKGIYMYGIASKSPNSPIGSSVLADQEELIIREKLAIAALELNQTEQRIADLREQNSSLKASVRFDLQAQQRIKELMQENEMLGARIEETHRHFGQRIAEYEAIIQTHINSPLEVKLAKKVVEKLPNPIRKVLRRCAAIGLAVVRG
jgi:protein-L-isoaspartate O-methyltransferase